MAIRELKVCLLGVSGTCIFLLFFVVGKKILSALRPRRWLEMISQVGAKHFARRLVWSKAPLFFNISAMDGIDAKTFHS